jgi:hypothetical protein
VSNTTGARTRALLPELFRPRMTVTGHNSMSWRWSKHR